MENLLQSFIEEVSTWSPKLGISLVVLALFLVLARIVKRLILKAAQRLKLDNNLALLFARSTKVTIIILGVITALGTLGIDVSALVAGLGLTGFALGFALKDTISNLLSGALILLYQPFKIGDIIKIAGYEGEVVTIDLRYTELQGDNEKFLIPNSKLFTDPITITSKQDQ